MATEKQQGRVGSSGVGVAGLLGVLFVGLKLTGHIAWSWWWVLAPFWTPFALLLIILAIGFFIYMCKD